MSTLTPRKPYTNDELDRLYPPNLQLQLVQVLMRHGERTPVSARFQNAGLQPYWPYCSAMRQMFSPVLEEDKDGKKSETFAKLEWKRRIETFGKGDAPVIATGPDGELDNVCDMGMLTDKGRETTFDLGKRLRSLYIDRLKFLPATIDSADFMYIRTTPIPRALESLQQSFAGLYPASTRIANEKGPFQPPTILTRAFNDETLMPNEANCKRLGVLSKAFAQRAADRWNNSQELGYVNSLIGKWMPPDSPRVAVDSHPRLSGIMDTINSTKGHGPETRLPKEFYDERSLAIIEKIGVDEWFSGYAESREYRTLGIGSLMGDIVARMVGSVEHSTADGEYELLKPNSAADKGPGGATPPATPIKFGLSGCHDTTLGAVMKSLGAYDGDKWPPYTSHLAIELFKGPETMPEVVSPYSPRRDASLSPGWFGSFSSKSSATSTAGQAPPGIGRKLLGSLSATERKSLDGYFVRLRFNDEPVTIPGCKTPGNHLDGDESICTLEAFKSIVDKYVPRDWRKQCRENIDKPAFPPKPEPAGY